MKIWSDILTVDDLHAACASVNHNYPGCAILLGETNSWGGNGGQCPSLYVGPRTRRIDGVHLRSMTHRRWPNSGTSPLVSAPCVAASWAEWGWFMVALFRIDANARLGDYRGLEDFHYQTGGRFRAAAALMV